MSNYMDTNIKPGIETTEYKQLRVGNTITWVLIALGVVVEAGNVILEQVQGEAPWIYGVGVVVAVAGAALRAFNAAGYTRTRRELKTTAIAATLEAQATSAEFTLQRERTEKGL